MKFKNSLILLFTFSALFAAITASSFSYSQCGSKAYLNTANLQCGTCPSNQIANTYQTVASACQCSIGYTASGSGTCSAIATTCSYSDNKFSAIYLLNGDNSGTTACLPCASNAYVNSNGTACTPCGKDKTYSSSKVCICDPAQPSLISTDMGCFPAFTNPSPSGSAYSNQLKYLFPGCSSYSDYQSCSYISNLCALSQGKMSTPECQFFSLNSLTSYLYANSSGFTLTFTKKSTITMKIASYLTTGNYLEERTFILSSLMKCGTPVDTAVQVQIGANIRMTCTYNVNHLIAMVGGKQWRSKMYQLLVKSDDGNYYDVGVSYSGSSQAIKRFFIEDTFTSSGKINLMTGFTLTFNYNTNNKLDSPQLAPVYATISIDSTGVSSSPLVAMNYQILFTNDISSFWTGALASFITISVIALIHTILKTYIGYLNKKSALQFFVNFAGVYSLWLYYYLLFMTGYWFLFSKSASTPVFLLPSHSTSLYGAFYALVAIMVVLRLVWVIIDKAEKLSTQVFVINWERSQFKNSWREIFVINSLAQFYTHRTISLFWMLVIVLFFTIGVNWQATAGQSASTKVTLQSLTPINRIFLYFIGCAVFLAVGLVFKILRRLSVLFWPYPFEDFVDYCTVANISLLFVKRRSPHAYYLHASIPDRTEVTYKEINEAIRRGLQKNRSITNQIPADSLKLYTIYLKKDIQDKHSNLLKVLQEQDNSRRAKFGKQSNKKVAKNPREDFIQNRLKPDLQGIAGGQYNRRTKSMIQNLCGTPPIDLRQGRQRGKSQVYFDDQLQLVNEVFPNGNQFQEIHTIMVVFLGWLTIVNSTPIAAFLTYFVDQYLFKWWIQYSCRNHLQEMTKVKKGFML